MKCLSCDTEILDDDVRCNGFTGAAMDIQIDCPNPECGRTMSAFISDNDWILDENYPR